MPASSWTSGTKRSTTLEFPNWGLGTPRGTPCSGGPQIITAALRSVECGVFPSKLGDSPAVWSCVGCVGL